MTNDWNEADLLGLLTDGRTIGSGIGLPWLLLGPGDDAGIVSLSENRYSICADLITEGVHFDLSYFPVAAVGRKAIAVNISDLAAMASTPLFATVTVASPKHIDLGGLLDGVSAAAEYFGITVVGGDLSASDRLCVSVTAIGINLHPPMLRSGARAGQTIMVTGPLGASQSGLRALKRGGPLSSEDELLANRHLYPVARTREAILLAENGVQAAIDISDGLLMDLWRMADASSVGFEIDRIPVAPGSNSDDAISGGEDFELLFTTDSPDLIVQRYRAGGLADPIEIGWTVEDSRIRTLLGKACEPLGYLH